MKQQTECCAYQTIFTISDVTLTGLEEAEWKTSCLIDT